MNNQPYKPPASIRNRQTCESLVVLQTGDLTLLMLIKKTIKTMVVRNTDGVDESFEHTIHEVGVLEVVNALDMQSVVIDVNTPRDKCKLCLMTKACSDGCAAGRIQVPDSCNRRSCENRSLFNPNDHAQ